MHLVSACMEPAELLFVLQYSGSLRQNVLSTLRSSCHASAGCCDVPCYQAFVFPRLLHSKLIGSMQPIGRAPAAELGVGFTRASRMRILGVPAARMLSWQGTESTHG